MPTPIERLAALIHQSRRPVFFGGAGVSTESGIPDFRSARGIYHQHSLVPPERILSHSFFMEHPDLFYAFYYQKLLSPAARPNKAHIALARLESMGKLQGVITQNINGLHQAAGSRAVYELHGSTARYHCLNCFQSFSLENILNKAPLPTCECGGLIRPEVVLYEENLDERGVKEATALVRSSDLLIVGGTSLMVYPAAALAGQSPGKLAIINQDPTPYDSQADLLVHSSIGESLDEAVKLLTGSSGR